MTKGPWQSRVGRGNWRLTVYKDQLIGVEFWPDPRQPDAGEDDKALARAYMVFKFPYRKGWRGWLMKRLKI